MKSIVALSLILAFTMPAAAAARNPLSCLSLLSAKAAVSRESSEKNFAQVIGFLRSAGARELLAPLDAGGIRPVFKARRLPRQSMVSGRQSWLGKMTLLVRELSFQNEKEKQEAVWETATALFELETRARLWSYRAMLTPDGQREFDLSMGGGGELLEYFLLKQPAEWRDLQLKRLEALENELYRVFASLNELRAEDRLPAQDPGRFWKLRALYGGDASRSIAPNQADFKAWQNGAPADLKARHGGNLLFNYYMNFLKRALVLSLAAQVAMAAPELSNLPGYLDTMFSAGQLTQEVDQGYVENLRKQVVREEERLKREIASQKARPAPEQELIRSLEKELSDLYDLYPWLVSGGSR
jgi:hypothetical protein